MQNIFPDLMIKMLLGNKIIYIIYIFFQISAVCIGVCAYMNWYMHATFLVGEIPDRFLGRALYG